MRVFCLCQRLLNQLFDSAMNSSRLSGTASLLGSCGYQGNRCQQKPCYLQAWVCAADNPSTMAASLVNGRLRNYYCVAPEDEIWSVVAPPVGGCHVVMTVPLTFALLAAGEALGLLPPGATAAGALGLNGFMLLC